MRSATDFLPRDISTLMNFATSVFTYFGSGRISRFGISLRRGMDVLENGGERDQATFGYADFGFLAPYFDRACLRSLTPAVSSAPRTMSYRTPGHTCTRTP